MPGRSPGQTPAATSSARSGKRASSPPTRVPCWWPAPGVDDQPGRLVDHHHVVVGVDHREVHAGFGLDVAPPGSGSGDR